MTGNRFDIRITLCKSPEHLILLLKIWLQWYIILHVTNTMVIFALPQMIRFNSKQYIDIWQALGTEISCFIPGPQGTAIVSIEADGKAIISGNFQAP